MGLYNDLTANFLDGPTGWEPQRENNGLIYLTPPVAIAGLDKILQFSVNQFPIPALQQQEVPHRYLNEERKFAGLPTYQGIQITFNDYLDMDTVGILNAWRLLVYNPANGKIGWKRNYAGSGHIDMFAPNGQVVRTHGLQGVWPSQFTPGQVNMQGDATVMCTLMLSIDKILYSISTQGDPTSTGVGGTGGSASSLNVTPDF